MTTEADKKATTKKQRDNRQMIGRVREDNKIRAWLMEQKLDTGETKPFGWQKNREVVEFGDTSKWDDAPEFGERDPEEDGWIMSRFKDIYSW